MTKYILNSGGLRNQPKKAEGFYKELVSGLGSKPKLLLCFFAEKRELWEEKFAVYSACFKEAIANTTSRSTFELAVPEKFCDQVATADVVMFYGGREELLLKNLSSIDLLTCLSGKTVGGNSAGSDIFVSAFWSPDSRQVENGLGIVPVKFIPHYNSSYGATDVRGPVDWISAKRELSEYGDATLPVYLPEEGDYFIFDI